MKESEQLQQKEQLGQVLVEQALKTINSKESLAVKLFAVKAIYTFSSILGNKLEPVAAQIMQALCGLLPFLTE